MAIRLKSALLFFLVLAIACPLVSQNLSSPAAMEPPDGWIEAPSSKANPALWECAGRGGSWVVSPWGGSVDITELDFDKEPEQIALPPHLKLSKEMIGHRSILRTPTGWLVGFNAREFGGGLWWFSDDGDVVRKLLSQNVHAIFETPDGIRILAGLAHLSLDNGEIDEFTETEDRVTLKYLANVGGSPEASALDAQGQIVVATPRSVVRVDGMGKVHKLYESGEDLMYPTSVVVDPNGEVFVAMRFFVLRLIDDNGNYRQQWLMPRKCRSFKMARYDCTCTGPS